MTRERALELADMLAGDFHQDLRGDIAETIRAAVAEEREACAKIATAAIGIPCEYDWNSCANEIAGKIRERGIR